MESRMYPETIKRIKDGLQRSRIGQLSWLQGALTPLDTILLDDQTASNPIAAISSSSGKAGFNTPTKAANGNAATEVQWKDEIQRYFLNYDNKTLQFLANGFEELLKCRNVSTMPFFA